MSIVASIERWDEWIVMLHVRSGDIGLERTRTEIKPGSLIKIP